MKITKIRIAFLLTVVVLISACSSMSKTQKGAAAGTVGGGAIGAVIGKASGNVALGAIIGAAVGGATGAIIGNQMDKQAEEIEKTVPGVKVERVGEGIVVEFSSNVLFGFDKSEVSPDAKTNLDKLITVLDAYPDTNIEIQGHTDSQGSKSYNQSLSERRAFAVTSYLQSKGLDKNRMTIKGYGETEPKYSNESESGRDQNRRVEFLITANQKMIDAAKNEAAN